MVYAVSGQGSSLEADGVHMGGMQSRVTCARCFCAEADIREGPVGDARAERPTNSSNGHERSGSWPWLAGWQAGMHLAHGEMGGH